jgi:DNA primase
MPARKIDFAALRAKLSFEKILEYYKFEPVSKNGDQWQGYCLLPTHGGSLFQQKQRSPSFSANVGRGIYHCFGCNQKGNVLEFVIRMEGFETEVGEQFRKGALRAQDIFLNGGIESRPEPRAPTTKQKTEPIDTPSPTREGELLEVVNARLDFVLQNLDALHPYLLERGFRLDTIRHFGLGFAQRGLMKDRVAIPIKNPAGELVGYAGRTVDDASIDEDYPKYLYPSDRERDGQRYVFRTSELLYHPDELRGVRSKHLFLVSGFPSVWWLWQNGIKAVAATMGPTLSERQAELIFDLTTNDARIVVVPDGEQAGKRLAETALLRLSAERFVRRIYWADEQQPVEWEGREIDALKSVLQ